MPGKKANKKRSKRRGGVVRGKRMLKEGSHSVVLRKKKAGGGLKTASGVGLTALGVLGGLSNASDPSTAIAGAAPLIASGVGLVLSDKKKKSSKKRKSV